MDESSVCPFCGGLNLHVAEHDLELGWSVLCLDCQASGPQSHTAEEAYAKWHDRHEVDFNPDTYYLTPKITTH